MYRAYYFDFDFPTLMLILISPAKLLNFKDPSPTDHNSKLLFPEEAEELATIMKSLSAADISQLMKLNPELGTLNKERYKEWAYPFAEQKAKQALFAFNGQVFKGINANSFANIDIAYAQKHLRILSGLYGLLRPLDMIMPYRLEMGAPLNNQAGKNLYAFWGDKITDAVNKSINESGSDYLINLSSNEYFKSVKRNNINVPVIDVEFKQFSQGKLKTIVVYTKMARGLMTSFIIKNKLKRAEDLIGFDRDGYYFNDRLSSPAKYVYTKD